MKRVFAMILALLSLCCTGLAEEEIVCVDGVSVIVLTPEEPLFSKGVAASDFTLPRMLTVIDEEAFVGISATKVEVSENVVSISRNAFADCENLRAITIPAAVSSIDDTALSGCENVTVYGIRGSEAERFAAAAGFPFIDQSPEPTDVPSGKEQPPVMLPFVPTNG